MYILIIGGSGRISLMTTQYLAKSHDVLVLNRGNRNQELGSIPTHICDINDAEEIRRLLDTHSFDVVLQFVAFDNHDIDRDYSYFKGRGIHYIVTSTCVTYDRWSSPSLLKEDARQYNPYSLYGQKKIAMEQRLKAIGKEDPSFHYTILRPSHTFDYRSIPVCLHGKNGTYSTISRILKGKPLIVPNDGQNIWPVLFAYDFALGVEGLLNNPAAFGQVYNITAEERHNWVEIYQILGEILQKPVKIASIPAEKIAEEWEQMVASLLGDKALNCLIDNSKLIELVPSFRNQTPLKESLKRSVDYMLSHKEEQKEDPEFDAWCDEMIEKYGKII